MTTFLVTWTNNDEERTYPFCSALCRWEYLPTLNIVICRDDSNYEFDEHCKNCGRLIPTSHDVVAEARDRMVAKLREQLSAMDFDESHAPPYRSSLGARQAWRSRRKQLQADIDILLSRDWSQS